MKLPALLPLAFAILAGTEQRKCSVSATGEEFTISVPSRNYRRTFKTRGRNKVKE